jgi:two-component system response regulator
MSNPILLVEDNPTDEKLTLRAFAKCAVPVEISVVRDGAEALDYLFASGRHAGRGERPNPRLVLLDLKLPRIDGIEVIRRLRANEGTALTPIVVLTASREEEDVRHCYAAGANAYVRKPVDFAHFVDAANTIAVFWLRLNEVVPARWAGA